MMHRIVILFFGIWLVSQPAYAGTRLGLHVTQEELTIWQQRAASGPYKNTGDVSTNSPDDWTRIKGKADALLPNALLDIWDGQTTAACWNPFTGTPTTPGADTGQRILNAGFAYLVLGTTAYRDAVRTGLLTQAGKVGTNFADTTRWCTTVPPSGNGIGDGYSWEIANFLTRLVFAYDYIRSSLSAGDQATLDTWFSNAATFWATAPDIVIKTRFPNRNTDNYTISGGWPSSLNSVTHFNCDTNSIGNQTYEFHEAWSNRGATQIRFAAAAGILTNNTYAKDQAQRWFKEWLQYAVFPDNMVQEYKRWDDYPPNSPTQGWSYTGLSIGAMASVADMFARNGDLSLYNYSTSNGLFGTAGGTKTLQSVMLKHAQFVTRTYNWIGEGNGTFCGNVDYLIQSIDLPGANNPSYGIQRRNAEAFYIQANLFYQNSTIKPIYLRTAVGAPAYPANPNTGGWTPWTGEWGVYPGALFMFGNMEGVVDPYNTPPTAPVLLHVAFQFRSVGGTEAAPDSLLPLNTNVTIPPGRCTVVRGQISNTVADAGALAFPLYAQPNGSGGYTVIPNCPSSPTGICFMASPPELVAGPTTEKLAGTGTFQPGRVQLSTAEVTTIHLTVGKDTEMLTALCVGAAATGYFDLHWYQTGGTPLTTYTQTPRITVVTDSYTFQRGAR